MSRCKNRTKDCDSATICPCLMYKEEPDDYERGMVDGKELGINKLLETCDKKFSYDEKKHPYNAYVVSRATLRDLAHELVKKHKSVNKICKDCTSCDECDQDPDRREDCLSKDACYYEEEELW